MIPAEEHPELGIATWEIIPGGGVRRGLYLAVNLDLGERSVAVIGSGRLTPDEARQLAYALNSAAAWVKEHGTEEAS